MMPPKGERVVVTVLLRSALSDRAAEIYGLPQGGTFGGPIAATLSSQAIDLTLSATPSRAVVCVTTPTGSAPERVPAAAGCGLATDATTTQTDNDAQLLE